MYIPESTIFLLEKEKFDIAMKDIDYLMKFNKATEAEIVEMNSIFGRYKEKATSLTERKL